MVKICWTEGKDKTEKQSFTANKKYCFNHDAFQSVSQVFNLPSQSKKQGLLTKIAAITISMQTFKMKFLTDCFESIYHSLFWLLGHFLLCNIAFYVQLKEKKIYKQYK